MGPMATQAHDAGTGPRSSWRDDFGRRLFERNLGKICGGRRASRRVVIAVVEVVVIPGLGIERPITRMLESGRSRTLLMISAVAIGTPVRHAGSVGGVVGPGLRAVSRFDANSLRGRKHKAEKVVLNETIAIQHTEVGVTVGIVATRAPQLGHRELTTR